jgi:hypothetical protein
MEKQATDLTIPRDTPIQVYFTGAHNKVMILDRTERGDHFTHLKKEYAHAAQE